MTYPRTPAAEAAALTACRAGARLIPARGPTEPVVELLPPRPGALRTVYTWPDAAPGAFGAAVMEWGTGWLAYHRGSGNGEQLAVWTSLGKAFFFTPDDAAAAVGARLPAAKENP